ncbi:ABC transporter permease [Pseudonocardia sichuanensis]
MNLLAEVMAWFATAANWTGSGGVPARLLEHLHYSGVALLIGLVVALPLGALVGHTGRGSFLVVGLGNGMRALPELGLLTLLVLLMGIGLLPVVLALAVLAVPPVLAGTYAGVRNVDRATIDAARGMGMREPQVLMKVELPNALPLILGGVRSAALQVIATAAIAAVVSYGGFGRYLIDGQRQQDYAEMVAGALLIALLALLVEGVLAVLQRTVVSPGLRRGGRRIPVADVPRTEPDTPRTLPSSAPEPAGVP